MRRKRIFHIVSNKYRKAYGRAAEVLCGLAECLVTLGEKQKGLALINEFRNEKFNRHSAFRSEVDQLVSASRLLK